jgi:putative membrane protein
MDTTGTSRVAERPRKRAGWRIPLHQVGEDPDYRFTLANERTFLAWLRTALALLAGGVAVVTIVPDIAPELVRRVIALVLLSLAALVAGGGYRRWSRNERALRLRRPLPPTRLPLLLAAGATVVVLAVLAAVVLHA